MPSRVTMLCASAIFIDYGIKAQIVDVFDRVIKSVVFLEPNFLTEFCLKSELEVKIDIVRFFILRPQ